MLETMNNLNLNDQVKLDDNKKPSLQHSQPTNPAERLQQHPLHQYDLTIMSKFYESCVGKMKEQMPKWQPTEWTKTQPMPQNLSWEQKNEWPNPMVISQKQRVYEAFARLARETGEPMILMPNFDYGDILNFERFLQALKQDGVNAIGKYKQYLNNKDMRKFEVDLVAIHPKYGVLLVEVKDCDHLDNKRRSRARIQLNNARSCFESMGRLIIEAKGWALNEAHIPVTEVIAVPNVQERPLTNQSQQQQQQPTLQTQSENPNQSATSTTSKSGRQSRILQFLIKSDLETQQEFAKWWTRTVVEPINLRKQQQEQEGKSNKFDSSLMNWMLGLINCIRNNSIMPVVYPETDAEATLQPPVQQSTQPQPDQQDPSTESSPLAHQPALNVHGEFLTSVHESVRSTLKCLLVSRDSEKIRKTICLQTLWLMLNDSQKKISVLCSEMNKQYYEEFFARQRKLYNNFHNVRFYTDLQSCAVNAQNTLKKDNEIWFFDSAINGSLSDVMERVKSLNAFWVFTTQEEAVNQYKSDLQSLNARTVSLDERNHVQETKEMPMPWLSGKSIKLPLRLQSDLLIIGDIIGTNQLRQLYRYLKSNVVANQSSHYQNTQSHSHHYNQYPQQQHLNFNPAKKFKSVKFIRGGTIDNLRNSLKMHDSIQSQVILLHVGDEDLFKTRHSVTTIERVKELATLVKEYCPKSFVVISTLMRRMSRTENGVTSEVNKGITNFCKQTRDTLNCYYMLNNHFEPDYHTQEGRILNNKGLKLYVENLLFCVDYFLIRNNKQH
jgi:hypothetical protein